MRNLIQRIVPSFLNKNQLALDVYLSYLRGLSNSTEIYKMDPVELVSRFKQCDVDGATVVQYLKNLDYIYQQSTVSRVGLVNDKAAVEPQLLVCKNQNLQMVDLINVRAFDVTQQNFKEKFLRGKIIYPDVDLSNGFDREKGI